MRRVDCFLSGSVVLTLLLSACTDDVTSEVVDGTDAGLGAASATATASDGGTRPHDSSATNGGGRSNDTNTSTSEVFDPTGGSRSNGSTDGRGASTPSASTPSPSNPDASANIAPTAASSDTSVASVSPTEPTANPGTTFVVDATDSTSGTSEPSETQPTSGPTHPTPAPSDAGLDIETTTAPIGSDDSTQTAPGDDAPCEELPFPRADPDDAATDAPRPDYEVFSGGGATPLPYVSASSTGAAHALTWGSGHTPRLYTWNTEGVLTYDLALTENAFLIGVDRQGNVFTGDYQMPDPWHIHKQAAAGQSVWTFAAGHLYPHGLRSFGGRHYLSGSRSWDDVYSRDTATLIALNGSGQKLWERGVDLEAAFLSGTVSATCEYVAMSGSVSQQGMLSPADIAASLYRANGELVWHAQLLAQTQVPSGPNADILVDVDGTVVISGRYRQAAFLQKRDVTGDVVWHRTFEDLPAWTTIAWTGEGTFMAAGVDAAGEAISVREFDLNGADRWSRTIDNLEGAAVVDSDVDPNGNIYLSGGSVSGGLLIRVNASRFTDIAVPPDGGVPGLEYADPDEGMQQSPSGQWCKQPVSIVEVTGTLRGLDSSQPDADRIVLDTFERYTLCPGETNRGCLATEDGGAYPNMGTAPFPVTVYTTGCAAASSGHPGQESLFGCCIESGVELLKVSTCTPEFEGRRCQPTEAPCHTEGLCENSECVPTVPLECDDGQYCNGEEWCDDEHGCRTSFSPAFDDDPATIDLCDEATDAVSHEPAPETPELCVAPLEVLGGRVADHKYEQWVYPSISSAELSCGEASNYCRRTTNGEWYASNYLGDPLSLPVNSGCSEGAWTETAIAMGHPYLQQNLQRCCVGESPFESGEPVGNSFIMLLP